MSRIDRLVVENFKSYGGSHIIGPFKTFTAIIGPNGAGKSNVMDAISFVLGVETKTLRGQQLRDLIHRKEDEKEQNRTAMVELVFYNSAAEEILFRRTLVPSGPTKATSHYSINGKIVKWSEYNEQLRDIGVLVKARNFLVFQGDVESIAQKSPKQLTELFESISGSAELKEEYETLKQRHAQAEEEFLRTFEKKRTIGKEKKQLKEQKEEAETFRDLQQKKQNLKKIFFLWQLYQAEKDLKEHQQQLDALQGELNQQREQYNTLDSEVKEKAKIYAQDRRKIANLEKTIQQETSALEKKRPTHIKMKEEISHHKKQLEKYKTQSEKLEEEYEKQQTEVKSLETDIEQLQAQKEDLKEETEEMKQFKLAAGQVAEYNTLKEKAGAKTATLRQELETLRRTSRLLQESYNQADNNQKNLTSRQEQLKNEIEQHEAKKNRMEKHITEVKGEIDELTGELETDAKKNEGARGRKAELQKQLDQLQAKLSEAKQDRRQTEKEAKLAAALETLKTLFPGKVQGRISELCKPAQQKHNLAVTIAMGKNMEAIVVEDERTAIECIQYMRDNRIGVATFLPLDSIKYKKASENLRNLGGSLKLVIDCIQYDMKHQKALLYALGNTLLCDTLEEARAFCFGPKAGGSGLSQYKVVTLDGTVIHKSGNLTGGVGTAHTKASKWNEVDLQKKAEDRDKLILQLQELERAERSVVNVKELAPKISGLKTRLQYSETDLRETKKKLAHVQAELKQVSNDFDKKNPEALRLKEQLDLKEEKLAEVEQTILKEESKIFTDFSKKVGVENIREFEEKRLKQHQKISEKQLNVDNQLARLRTKLEYEKKRDLAGPVNELKTKIDETKKKLKETIADEKKFSSMIENKKKTLEEKTTDTKQKQADLDSKHEDFLKLKKEATAIQKKMGVIERKSTQKETQVEQLRSIRSQVFKRSKLEQVEIPLKKGGSEKKSKSKSGSKSSKKRKKPTAAEEEEEDEKEGKKSKKRKKPTAAAEEEEEEKDEKESKDDDDEDLQVDYSELEKEQKDVKTAAKYDQIKADFEAEIAQTTAEIEKLAPNMKAIEHFKDVKDRLATTQGDWNQRKQEAQAASEAFEKKKQERTARLLKAYEHVAKEIDPIYKGLTQGTNFPMGGKAYLHLENNEEPYMGGIKYTAMPPMKRFRDMTELSGGEQTIAALALLFAIHSFHPAPFFVLDEVDAALDNINVGKISQYIRNRSRKDKLQCVVISLKETFYTKADGLVGVYRDQKQQQSGTATIDLTTFD